MIDRILPLLNDLIPEDIAIKGISKVSPKLGEFIKSAALMGFSAKDSLGYLKNQAEGKSSNQNLRADELAGQARIKQGNQFPDLAMKALKGGAGGLGAGIAVNALGGILNNENQPELASHESESGFEEPRSEALGNFNEKVKKNSLKDNLQDQFNQEYGQKKPEQRNILQQYSPELYQFLVGHIQQGRSPLEAGAIAQQDKKFLPIIKRLEKDHKAPFSSILQAIFPAMGQQLQGQSEPNQQGQGQQALMQSMQQLQQLLGKRK